MNPRTYFLVYVIGEAGSKEFPLAFFFKKENAWKFRDELDKELDYISRYVVPMDIVNLSYRFPIDNVDWYQLDSVYVDCVAIDECVIVDPAIQQLLLLPDGT